MKRHNVGYNDRDCVENNEEILDDNTRSIQMISDTKDIRQKKDISWASYEKRYHMASSVDDTTKPNDGKSRVLCRNRASRRSIIPDVAVDGCMAWLTAAAACWLYIIYYGFFRSGGLFLVFIVDEMDATRQAASWPFTLAYAFHFLTGPAVSLLNHRFNSRLLACIGSLIACVGVATCYYAKNVLTLTFLLGGLYGAGSGLTIITSVIVINKHFIRHRAKANGIQAAGSSLGSLATPLVAEMLLSNIGLKRSFVVFAIVVFTSVIGSLLLRDPKRIIRSRQPSSVCYQIAPNNVVPNKADEAMKPQDLQNTLAYSAPRNDTSNEDYDAENSEDSGPHYSMIERALANSSGEFIQPPPTPENEEKRPLLFDNNSIGDTSKCDCKNHDIDNKNGPAKSTRSQNRVLRAIRHPMFWIICLNEIVYSWVKEMYYTIIVDYSIGIGIEEAFAAALLSISSVGDLVGRLGQGFFIDTKLMRPSTVIFCALVGCGSLFFVLTIVTNSATLIVTGIAIGLCTGSLVGTRFLVVLEYLEEDLLPTVVGLVLFIAGIFHLTRPLVLGWFRDVSGSYTNLLYLQGIMCFVTACVWLWKLGQRFKETLNKKKETKAEVPNNYGSTS